MLRSWLGVVRQAPLLALVTALMWLTLTLPQSQAAPSAPPPSASASSSRAAAEPSASARATAAPPSASAHAAAPPPSASARATAAPIASAPAASEKTSSDAPPAAGGAEASHVKLAKLGKRPGRVVVIPIHDMIDLGLAPFVQRVLREPGQVSLVILDVNTFGGRVDAAVKIRDSLLEAKVPTLAFINRRAISAGALISLAADTIVFTPGATMGAATPIQLEDGKAKPVAEKMVSYMRSEMRATAQAKGRNGEIAEAMVDADIEVPTLSAKGKLLTLTTKTATSSGISDAIADSLDELLERAGLRSRPLVYAKLSSGEELARFLTDPTVAGLLMSLGMLGLMIELYSPGFGAPGIVGITSLALFFGGHWFAALAGVEELVLAAIGLGLLALEIFVIPGFGWAGVTGILCLVASLTLSMVGVSIGTAWHTGALTSALGVVLLAFVGSVAAMVAAFFALRRAGKLGQYSAGSWFVLHRTLATANAALPDEAEGAAEPYAGLVGQRGHAETDLRPAGKARIGGKTYDVVSSLHYISRGRAVEVNAVEGVRIVVIPTEESDAD